MQGQWIGNYFGSNNGKAVIDIDDKGNYYEGYACMFDENKRLPVMCGRIITENKNEETEINVPLFPIDPITCSIPKNPIANKQIMDIYPGVIFPKNAKVRLRCASEFLEIEWKTDIESFGSCKLPKSKSALESEYQPEPVNCWDEFESYVRKLEHYNFIYRGQMKTWRLRTSFHRTGRAALLPFMEIDIHELHRRLSAKTKHIFNLDSPVENGAFYNLVQHHGYPTPLLDWTYSPYVAAYFAYHGISNKQAREADDTSKVRIIIFDQNLWRRDFTQVQFLAVAQPHFSILNALAIENERSTPQHSISSVTNIDDIESYIMEKESEMVNKRYLRVIDLPWRERTYVMRQLALMGITAGSLFPGIDGTCQEMKERFFDT